ncbi:UDP-N-acetylglucosamine 2-epimerase (non-hydrolyzing) [Ralstonia pickettii]|uniref:UDP-N-acetylglucosamine 2-epimerase (non-hydrolyzing) n=1 Tax=Ralstonia pickettii TaxID=329 RepID=A0A2N4TQB8_RALPI|nr:UDP-N-acetylglucosamine 2-epimerase (non-hydrolyzing) [Ralstonia pickettii]PLC41897.1 UDP-N-acetylglucosamine 2-epimerase (non-hydrolyzing) [Ralstonia pickettii]
MKILSVFGTRPEAIKMAPLVKALAEQSAMESVVCVTGQHKQMLQQVLDLFDIVPQIDLELMTQNQTLNGLSARLLTAFDDVLETVRPDRILVHGDTTTAMMSAMAAFHRRIPIGHVEAGLRTGDLYQPWPEEMNRRTIDVCADLLFAPTDSSRRNLQAENLGGRILVTGNTVIDALLQTTQRILKDDAFRAELDAHFPFLKDDRKVLLVTGHRRENFGSGFSNICEALAQLARRDDIQIVYPIHLNPNVRGPVQAALAGLPNVHLIEPLDYARFVRLMQRAHVILTDSGGVQEEAPSLGKPVLVMRNVTERPEAVQAGTVRLVGTEVDSIVGAVSHLYDNDDAWRAFSQRLNPYGDGLASQRIVAALGGAHVQEFLGEELQAA